jgi:hypothetical protein
MAACVGVGALTACGTGPEIVGPPNSAPNSPTVSGSPVSAVPVGDDWWGWNPESADEPPLLPELPWHTNTGLWRAEDRDTLTVHDGDFTTTSDGQVIDRLDITGKLYVNHENVVVKRSWLRDRIENSTDSPVRVIHCDIGDGKVGNYTSNGAKGVVQIYRSNVFGVSDGVQTTPSRGAFVLQDSFLHDYRYASDPRTPGGNVHNDGFKADSKFETTISIKHNTFWSWTMNNMTEEETATRSSGPNWTDHGDPLSSTGNTARDGTPENGLQNSAVMIADQPVVKVYIDGNLFRGHTYAHINVQAGYVEVTNNMFAEDEHVRGRPLVSGRESIAVWSNNTNYETGEQIPQIPAGR